MNIFLNPKIIGKITIKKINVDTGEVKILKTENTITRDALKRFNLEQNWRYGSSTPRTKIISPFHPNDSRINEQDRFYLYLLKNTIISKNYKDVVCEGETTFVGFMENVSHITFNGNTFYKDTHFTFFDYCRIKWIGDQRVNGYPRAGQTFRIYYLPFLFTSNYNDFYYDNYIEKDTYILMSDTALYKDSQYVYRLDMKFRFHPDGNVHNYGGIFLRTESQYQSILDVACVNFNFSQDYNEILDIFYSIYIDYSALITNNNSLFISYPYKGYAIEHLIDNMFFVCDPLSYGSTNRAHYYYTSYYHNYSFQFRGIGDKSLLSLAYAPEFNLIIDERRYTDSDETNKFYGGAFTDLSHKETFPYGNTRLFGSAYHYCYGIPPIKRWTVASFGNICDLYTSVSRAFLHSINYSYDETNRKTTHIFYPFYENDDIYIQSRLSVYIDKQKENFGIELDKSCPVTPWVYIIKFTSGGQSTGQYIVYKSPLVTLNGLQNDEDNNLVYSFLSWQAITKQREVLKEFYFDRCLDSNSYYQTYREYTNKNSIIFRNDTESLSLLPSNNIYSYTRIRTEISDVNDKGFYGLVLNDREFQIRHIDTIGGVTHTIKKNREKFDAYKKSAIDSSVTKYHVFKTNYFFKAAIVLMTADNYENPPDQELQIYYRKASENQDFQPVQNLTPNNLHNQINLDFSKQKYHWSPIMTFDTVEADEIYIDGLTKGYIYFLTQDDYDQLTQFNGSGKDLLEFSNAAYGTCMSTIGENYCYFATKLGLLRIETPDVPSQKIIDEQEFTQTLFCPYQNYNLDTSKPKLSIIFPSNEVGKIYMLYDDGSLFVFNEYDESITQINTSVNPWSAAGNLTPQELIFKFWDLRNIVPYNRCYMSSSGYTANCIVRPQNKFAAWVNSEGDIIIFKNGVVEKIFKPSTDYNYIDLNTDPYNQKYILAVRDQYTLDYNDDQKIDYITFKCDVFDIDTHSRVINGLDVLVGLSCTPGKRFVPNIFYDADTNRHYIISNLGTGFVVEKGSIDWWYSSTFSYEMPKNHVIINNSNTLRLPCCETYGSEELVSVAEKQLAGFINWFSRNNYNFSMLLDIHQLYIGVDPKVTKYGYDYNTDEWVENGGNPVQISSKWHTLPDNLKIRFDVNPDTNSLIIEEGESITVTKVNNSIIKDNLQDIKQINTGLYFGTLNEITDKIYFIKNGEVNLNNDINSPYFLTFIDDDLVNELYINPINEHVINEDLINPSSPIWSNISSLDVEVVGTSGNSINHIQAPYNANYSHNDKLLYINVCDQDIPLQEFKKALGKYKMFRIEVDGYRYYLYYDNSKHSITATYLNSDPCTEPNKSATYNIQVDEIGREVDSNFSLDGTLYYNSNAKTIKLDTNTYDILNYFSPSTIEFTNDKVKLKAPLSVIPYHKDDRYLGLLSNRTFAIDSNTLIDEYLPNRRVKFYSTETDSYKEFIITSAGFNPYEEMIIVSVNNNILTQSESPNEDFYTDSRTISAFVNQQALAPIKYKGAFLEFIEINNDYTGISSELTVKTKEFNNILPITDIKYYGDTNKTFIQFEKNIELKTPYEINNLTVNQDIFINLVSIINKIATNSIQLQISSIVISNGETTITLNTDYVELDGNWLNEFRLMEDVFIYSNIVANESTYSITNETYDPITNETIFTISASGVNGDNIALQQPSFVANFEIDDDVYITVTASDGNIFYSKVVEKTSNNEVKVEDDINMKLNTTSFLNYEEFVNFEILGATNKKFSDGYKIYATRLENPPSDSEHYYISKYNTKLRFNSNLNGNMLTLKRIRFTTYN